MSKKRNRTTALPKILKGQPNEDLRIKQGRTAFKHGAYTQAILHWEGVLASHSALAEQEPKVKAALAEAYFRRGQHDLFVATGRALDDLAHAARLKADDPLYAYHVGLAWHRQGEPEKAIAGYRQALTRDPAFKRATYPLALALVQSGQDATQDPVWQALDETQRLLLQRKPAADSVSQGLGLAAAGQWTEARQVLSGSGGKVQSPLARGLVDAYLGIMAQRSGDGDTALAQWWHAFDLGINTPALVYNLTLAYTLRAESALAAGRPEEAATLAKRGLSVAPENRRLLDIAAYSRLQAGYSAAEKGDWEKALNHWNNIENLAGLNARALAANQAIAFEKLEDWESAAEAWREFVRRRPRKEETDDWLSPEQVARLWARVSSLYMRADASEEAITTLQTALKYQPDDPALLLSLARCYVDAERIEAAYNQLDRVLELAPHNLDALVLRAELAQSGATRRGFWNLDAPPGTHEWEAVLATNDEAYAPIARERLSELYADAVFSYLEWGRVDLARAVALRGLERLPGDHTLRAHYVRALLIDTVDETEAQRQIERIDLTDGDALHQLIDTLHITGRHREAADLLKKAGGLKPLEPAFYLGIANCALNRSQPDFAETYFDQALNTAAAGEAHQLARLEIGLAYAMHNRWDKAEAAWQAALKENPAFGLAHQMLASAAQRRGDKHAARDHQQAANRWASATHRQSLLDQVRVTMQMLNSPLGRLSLPDMMAMLDNAAADDDDAAFGDFDFGSPFGPTDPFNSQQAYDPMTDRRRRRMQKRGGKY
jgi:tetratricopeptide (TPR) repeat protein